MNPKKKSRRCRGHGLDSGLDLAISRFIYSFGLIAYPLNINWYRALLCLSHYLFSDAVMKYLIAF
jgi:hypothetical protein